MLPCRDPEQPAQQVWSLWGRTGLRRDRPRKHRFPCPILSCFICFLSQITYYLFLKDVCFFFSLGPRQGSSTQGDGRGRADHPALPVGDAAGLPTLEEVALPTARCAAQRDREGGGGRGGREEGTEEEVVEERGHFPGPRTWHLCGGLPGTHCPTGPQPSLRHLEPGHSPALKGEERTGEEAGGHQNTDSLARNFPSARGWSRGSVNRFQNH